MSNFFCFGPLKFGKVFENVMMPQLRFSLDRVEEVIFVVEMMMMMIIVVLLVLVRSFDERSTEPNLIKL